MNAIWQHFNIHLVWPDKLEEKITVTALNKDDALMDTRAYRAREAGAYCLKVIGPLNRESTPKQKLAQKYGFIIGSIKGAKVQFTQAMTPDNIKDAHKLVKNWNLTMQQFAKLERDIRDCFKLAGLKVK